MTLGGHDPFRDVRAWDAATASEWARALERRADAEDQRAFRRRILSLAAVTAGHTVVEVGCGVGVLLVELAAAVSPGGRVVGIEPQPAFAAHAEARVRALASGCRAEVRPDSADRLGLPDGLADVCVAQTVLVHLPEAVLRAALAEMVRVTRPGGRVISVDQDGDTWVIDHPDRDLTRRIVRFNSDQRFADGWTARRMRRHFGDCGLGDVRVEVWPHVDTDRASYLFGSCVRLAHAAAAAGAIAPAERDRWLHALDALADRDQFLSCISYFATVGVVTAAAG